MTVQRTTHMIPNITHMYELFGRTSADLYYEIFFC
jgi:hypothetical protein